MKIDVFEGFRRITKVIQIVAAIVVYLIIISDYNKQDLELYRFGIVPTDRVEKFVIAILGAIVGYFSILFFSKTISWITRGFIQERK